MTRCAHTRFFVVALFVLFAGPASPAAAQSPRPPNILLILADDLGYAEMGTQGNRDVPTPHIDSLAKQGVRFTSGYVSAPLCVPTRAGLMTGRYQQRFGLETNPGPEDYADEKFGLPRSEPTIAERLKSSGYVTGMFGKWHIGYKPELQPTARGFDEFFGFPSGETSGPPHDTRYRRFQNQHAIRRGDWKPVQTRADLKPQLHNLAANTRESTDLADREPAKLKELGDAWAAWNARLLAPQWRRQDAQTQGRAGQQPARGARGSLEARFTQYDRNGDGTLTPDEVPSGLFARMDKNKDGVVTFEEAKAFYAGRRTTPRPTGVDRAGNPVRLAGGAAADTPSGPATA